MFSLEYPMKVPNVRPIIHNVSFSLHLQMMSPYIVIPLVVLFTIPTVESKGGLYTGCRYPN